MGVAILSILLTHLNCDLGSFALNRLALCCQGGVDAFFFMSGFGLYYSAQKGHSTLTFYKRRALRIFPSFLCLFATMMLMQHNFTWQRAFHHTRLLVSSHTPIHVRLVCIRHSAALCRISGIFAMVCRTTKISHSYGCRYRSGLNQHLRRIFHGTAPWRIQPIHISCRTHAYILHRHLCRMAIAAAMHQTSTQQNQSWFSRRIMHYLGTIQHGNQPIRFHDHAQHRTALSAIHIDCTRRLRIIRTVVPQNGKAPHYPFPSQNVATCGAMHTRGISANRHNLSLQHNSSPKPRHLQSYSKDFNSSAYAAVSMGHSHLHKIHHEQNTIKP